MIDEFYLIIVCLLFLLAITDLIVGVSNDAVNFLNSSIGSKVASRKVIMIVASIGILAGAAFSSGMMEVARKGVFHPESFFFSEIMIIFIAVMLTDIILLDLFNTFGMPTSTTVSIVFELLGAAVAIAVLKIAHAGDSLDLLGSYINSSSALLIISGIFLSVLIAFAVGSLVQFVSRFLFTFHIKRQLKWVGAIWSGLALSGLTYFLLIKGLKGASFISDSFVSYLSEHTLLLLGVSFLFWSLLMQFLLAVFRVNILRIVVLFGTFALAMAFAGNDLVNFIGVPIAGLESYLVWDQSGSAADGFEMYFLNQPIRTNSSLLLLAGGIMVLTLWFSKKARSVTETEVNLGRQEEGAERFRSNMLSRAIVRQAISLGKFLQNITPLHLRAKIAQRFQPYEEPDIGNPPAFDLVRASVNLTVASALIAFATSLKLPLSTTYVSFMVAMGTSLADKAWGRSSAAYRVAGVLNVIGGWFLTAFLAFTAASLFATLLYFLEIYALIGLVLLVVFLISRTFLLHKRKEQQKASDQSLQEQIGQLDVVNIIAQTKEKVIDSLKVVRLAYAAALTGLLAEDRTLLQKAKKDIQELKKEHESVAQQLFGLIKHMPVSNREVGRVYLLIFDLEQDILQSTSLIVATCSDYVANSLEPMYQTYATSLQQMTDEVDRYLSDLTEMIQHATLDRLQEVIEQKRSILYLLEERLTDQIEGIQSGEFGSRESMLIFRLVLESKDLIAVAARFATLYQRYYERNTEEDPLMFQK